MNYSNISIIKPYPSLEKALLEILPITKSQLKKHCSKKILAKPVREKSQIEIPLSLANYLHINPRYDGPPIEVIYEDDIFFVVNKPSSIHTCPQSYVESNNVLSFIREYFPQYLLVNSDHYDRGLLHRLDYSTSGVLICIKDDKTLEVLRKNYHRFVVVKEYQCIVEGKFNKSGRHIHRLMSYGPKGGLVKVNLEGKECALTINCLDYSKTSNRSLLKVQLETGHRHQIRAQLQELGFPIIGDNKYGGQEADRLYLHSHCYKIKLEDTEYEFLAPIPISFSLLFNLNS